MPTFIGEYKCKIDSKSRLLIPSGFRRLIAGENADKFMISLGGENCLNLYPIDGWKNDVERRLHDLPRGIRRRKIVRFYSGMSRQVEMDKTGRIAIPRNFLQKIGDSREVYVIGMLNYLEIWSAEEYASLSEKIVDEFDELDWEY